MLLEVSNLSVSANGKKILANLNLNINKGEVHTIMGPNGTGKSYALRIPNSGMKKLLTMANSTFNQLFEST